MASDDAIGMFDRTYSIIAPMLEFDSSLNRVVVSVFKSSTFLKIGYTIEIKIKIITDDRNDSFEFLSTNMNIKNTKNI
jgi:hypothetical protein